MAADHIPDSAIAALADLLLDVSKNATTSQAPQPNTFELSSIRNAGTQHRSLDRKKKRTPLPTAPATKRPTNVESTD